MSAAQWRTLCRIHIWSHGTKKYLAGWQTMQWNLEKKGFYSFLNDEGCH